MGVRRTGDGKRAFATRLEIGIKNQIFLETPEVGILIPINRFDSCNLILIYLIYLFMSRHEVHCMNTHTLQNAG